MRYLMTYLTDQSQMADATEEEMRGWLDAWTAFDREAIEAGVLIAGVALQDSSTATTIEMKESGEKVTTDGPFAESKEQLGGFHLLECENLDEALEWAHKVPLRAGYIEVKPARDFSELGYETPTPGPIKAAA